VRPRIAVTLGDPRGIGPEVAARALEAPLDAEVTAALGDKVYAAESVLARLAQNG